MAIAGDDRASNRAWMMNVLLAARIESIDGNPSTLPGNDVGLRGMVERCGREGLAAILTHLSEQPDEGAADEASAKN